VGIHYPEELGGQGYGTMEHVLVTEQFCRKDSGIGVCYEIFAFSTELLIHHGSDELKKKWVPRVASGESMSAGGYTEPNHGSDITVLDTTARRDGDEWVINGAKTFISNGSLCDFVVLLCMTDPEADPPYRGMSMILVETDRPGFVAEDVGAKMGVRMSATSELSFTDVRVPVTNLIGQEGKGLNQVIGFFTESRVCVAGQALGIAQGAFDRAVDWVKKREQGGKPLAEYQVTRHKIADMATKLELARLITYKSAWMLDNGKRDYALDPKALPDGVLYEMVPLRLGPPASGPDGTEFYPVLGLARPGGELKEGMAVVTRGNLLLDSQAQLTGKPSLLFPQGSRGGAGDAHAGH